MILLPFKQILIGGLRNQVIHEREIMLNKVNEALQPLKITYDIMYN
jgi:hypothetical protein